MVIRGGTYYKTSRVIKGDTYYKKTGFQGVTHNTEQTGYQRVTVQNKQGTKGWLYRVRYNVTNMVPKDGSTEKRGHQRGVPDKKSRGQNMILENKQKLMGGVREQTKVNGWD